jgi:DNA polymerase III subunit epsilon
MSRGPGGPPRQARRDSWTGAELVALDFETTGLDLRRDAVVSFGVVPVTGGRIDLAGSVYREVAPAVEPSASSIRIHLLRPQDLASAPTMEAVADALAEAIERRFVLAWAADIEIGFLRRTFGGSNRRWRGRTIDVRTLALALDRLDGRPERPGAGTYSLERTAERFAIPVEQTHHALDDAFMTAELFLAVAAGLAHHGYRSVRSLVRVTNARRLPVR